jgi:hypothetical protein
MRRRSGHIPVCGMVPQKNVMLLLFASGEPKESGGLQSFLHSVKIKGFIFSASWSAREYREINASSRVYFVYPRFVFTGSSSSASELYLALHLVQNGHLEHQLELWELWNGKIRTLAIEVPRCCCSLALLILICTNLH